MSVNILMDLNSFFTISNETSKSVPILIIFIFIGSLDFLRKLTALTCYKYLLYLTLRLFMS